jgi:hypothetical protein
MATFPDPSATAGQALCTPCVRESDSACIAKKDAQYGALPETAKIDVTNGYVTFSCTLKYFGLKISYSLCDNDNIKAHLVAALQSMDALKEVLRNQHLDTYIKYLLICTIPMNLLLGGGENWSLKQDLLRHLKVFLHQSIRRILRISISTGRNNTFRTRNEKVCHMFYVILCVKNMIAARQLGFLGKVVWGALDRPAYRMLTACCQHKRNRGHLCRHNKDVIISNL